MDFTELHLHDYYSTLDGLNSPAEYMKRAVELGMTHLPQTNHGTLGGQREFQVAAKEAGIIPILGVEAYISSTDRHDRRSKAKRTDGTNVYNHIILLAQGDKGLESLNRLNEIAWNEGFYNKPRIDLDALEEYNEGIIALSGCMSGLLARAIEADNIDQAFLYAKRLQHILPGRFYIEIQGHNDPKLNEGLLLIADTLGIPPVVTSDCHYARKEDLWIEEAMLILSTNPKPNFDADFTKSQKMDVLERFNYLYPDRMMTFEQIEIYLKSAGEHRSQLAKQGITRSDVIDNTMRIAESVEPYRFYEGLDLLPRPKNNDPDTLLEKKAWAGLKKRGLDKDQRYVDRLREELQIIKDKDFSTYFLIVANMILWARGEGIRIGPGRGSAAGSLLCYALTITDIDPIKYNLLFFRFINPERNDFPDIDVDIQKSRRGEVKEYLRRQFKNVASIATVNRFQGKGVLRDAARVFRVPLAEVNKALKNIDTPPDVDYFPVWLGNEKGRAFNKKYPEVLNLAEQLHGRVRSTGMHAAGLVIANQPISNFAPIESAKEPNNPASDRIPLVPYDMHDCEGIGLVKMDLLGLKALDVVDDTLKMVKEARGIEIDLEAIDLEDQRVYKMLSDGYTKGIFQCEQPAYTSLILRMGGVWSFDDLAVSNALGRPGAANTIGPEYIARKNGKAVINYIHEDAKWFTEETFGTIVYQEQVMLAITELAGLPMATADKIRKIIGKKKDVSEFLPYKEAFVNGASGKIGEKNAEKLWEDFEHHAEYSFNKSHSVAYSLVSYWTAWLKYHYPREFMCATLMHEEEKDSLTDYLIEAKRLGIKVFLPHVNVSEKRFSLADGGIRFGLTNIKYVADAGASRLIQHRPYANYAELQAKVMEKGSGLTSRVLTGMNAIGAATFADNPKSGKERENFYEYLNIPAFETPDLPPAVADQFITLDEYEEKGCHLIMAMVRNIKKKDNWARIELVDETGSAGIFHDYETLIQPGQMYAMLVADNRVERFAPVDDLVRGSSNTFVKHVFSKTYADLTEGFHKVVAFRSYTTKANKKMAYMVFSNADKELYKVMAFPQQYIKAYTKCREGEVVYAELKETDSGSLFIDKVE